MRAGKQACSGSPEDSSARSLGITVAIGRPSSRPSPGRADPTITVRPVPASLLTIARASCAVTAAGLRHNSRASQWVRSLSANLKASTVRFYQANLDRYVLAMVGRRPIGALNRSDCRTLVAGCEPRG